LQRDLKESTLKGESVSQMSAGETVLKSKILANTSIYINGSTMPYISDHAVRQLIAQHGGYMSTALLRKQVTHVILTAKVSAPSTDADAPSSLGAYITNQDPEVAFRQVSAGGGLAAGKIKKEVEKVRGIGKGVKYVNVKWVLDSVKAGKRLDERPYADWRFVSAHQGSMTKYFAPTTKGGTFTNDEKCEEYEMTK